MTFSGDVNYTRLKEVIAPMEMVLSLDLEGLRRKDETERIGLWNQVKASQITFEADFLGTLPRDLKQKLLSRYQLSKLLLAATAAANGEDSSLLTSFNDREIALVREFEKFNIFDVLTTDDLVERIARREDIYELVIDFYKQEYSHLDDILEASDIQRDLKYGFKSQYAKRFDKVVRSVQAYVGKFGPVMMVSQVEKHLMDVLRQSETRREKALTELETHVAEISTALTPLNGVEDEDDRLKEKLSLLEANLAKGEADLELAPTLAEKDAIVERYSHIEDELTRHLASLGQKQQELEERENELVTLKQEFQDQMEEEKQRLVEGELGEIALVKERLASESAALDEEREMLVFRKEELDSRLQEIDEALEGKPLRIVSKEDAQWAELNIIARFETKMETLPFDLRSPIDNKKYSIKNIKQWTHEKYTENLAADLPANTRSRYAVTEKKHGLFGQREERLVFEAVVLNHIGEYQNYGYDARRANLGDFLAVLHRYLNKAESGRYLHVIGIASPTGWDERVIAKLTSSDFSRNYVSCYVSVCLVDSTTGDYFANLEDNRIARFVDYFILQFDEERVAAVKKYLTDKLSRENYVVFTDALEETGEKREIVNKASQDLANAGGYRLRVIKDVGLVIEPA